MNDARSRHPLVKLPLRTCLLLLPCLAILTACGGGSGGGTPVAPPDNTVASVSVTPGASLSLQSGATSSLTAIALNRGGTALSGRVATWSSSDPTIASVSGGVVTALLVGTASITAQVGGISSPPVTVTVSAGAPAQLGVRTNPDRAASGVAMFSGLTISGLAGPRTMTFTAAGVSTVTSATFTLTFGNPAQLAIATAPVAGTAYAPFTTPAVVNAVDASGNLVTTWTQPTATES